MKYRIWLALRDTIAPPDLVCVLCGSKRKICKGFGVCEDCMRRLPYAHATKHLSDGTDVISAMFHEEDAARLVYMLKYGDGGRITGGYAAYVLAAFIAEAVQRELKEPLPADTIVVPVAQHRRRYLLRGYNPARLLARALAEKLDLKLAAALRKTVYTPHQTGLSYRDRQHNVSDTFYALPGICKDHSCVLLVDDVVTTGATLRACTQALRAAGAERIVAVTATCTRLSLQKR
jgi:ComF family protein